MTELFTASHESIPFNRGLPVLLFPFHGANVTRRGSWDPRISKSTIHPAPHAVELVQVNGQNDFVLRTPPNGGESPPRDGGLGFFPARGGIGQIFLTFGGG